MVIFSCPVGDIFEVPAAGINIRSEAFISEEQLSFNIEQMIRILPLLRERGRERDKERVTTLCYYGILKLQS